jgi:DNA-3-methyladenine glycosylase
LDALNGDAVTVAPLLLGAHMSTSVSGDTVGIIINEVEAYRGAEDPASHAYRGRTDRTAPMFGPPGTVYVYRSYGIHWCVNVVVGDEGVAQAVLIRGGRVTEGVATAIARRGRTGHLADGPGKLTQALGIDGSLSGSHLADGDISLRLHADRPLPHIATERIGISKATERLWRFVATAP